MFSKSRSNNAHKIDSHPLYSRPCRVAIPVLQGLNIACNTAITIVGCLMMVFDDLTYQDDGLAFVSFLIWVLIPLLLLIASVIDTIKRRKRTLSPRYTIASAVFGIILWIGYAFISLVDTFDTYESWNASEWLYNTHLFTAIPAVILYATYLIFAIIARRREKTWAPPLGTSNDLELQHSQTPRPSETSDLSKQDKE